MCSSDLLEGLAAVALSHGDYTAAVQYYSRLVNVAPDVYEAWFNLGIAYQKTGRLEQAMNAYREAGKVRPDAVEANANLGAALQERGDLEGAAAVYAITLEAAAIPGVLWNLAIARERQGDLGEAERLYAKLTTIDPAWEDAAFRLDRKSTRLNSSH